MPKVVDGVITGWGDASRQFRTTRVTVKDFVLRADDGSEIRVPRMRMQLPVANLLHEGSRARFYMSSGRFRDPMIYGVRLQSGYADFDGDTDFDMWIVAGMYWMLGIAFSWLGIGLVLVYLGWKSVRQMRDARAAKRLFNADAPSAAAR